MIPIPEKYKEHLFNFMGSLAILFMLVNFVWMEWHNGEVLLYEYSTVIRRIEIGWTGFWLLLGIDRIINDISHRRASQD